jgi:tripartite-type tricarboxylate transporter receptor subunit TctC
MNGYQLARRAFALGLTCGALALSSAVLAQARITRIIVAFPPGGPVDFVARTLAEQLGKELGHQVIIENKAGANGAIAAEFVSRSAPDGNTLWLTSVGAVAINPALYDKLSYDQQRDLAPVSLVVITSRSWWSVPTHPTTPGPSSSKPAVSKRTIR